MKKWMNLLILMVSILFPNGAASIKAAEAEKELFKNNVLVNIDGLACPFCAFGVEKHLKKVAGVKTVQVNLGEGTANLTLNPGAEVTGEQIRQAVKKAGFQASEITNVEELPTSEDKKEITP